MLAYLGALLPEGVNNSAVVSTAAGAMEVTTKSALAVTFLQEVALFNNALVYFIADSGGARDVIMANASQAADPFGVGGPMAAGDTFLLRFGGTDEVRVFEAGTRIHLGVLANAYDPQQGTMIGWPALPDTTDPCRNGKENNQLVNAYSTNAALNPERCYPDQDPSLGEHFKQLRLSWPGFLGGAPFTVATWEDLRRDAWNAVVDPFVADHDFNDGMVAWQLRPISPIPCGGRTPGFWQGPNGQALLDAEDLAALRELHLVGSEGAPFDPASPGALVEWLKGGNARNMAYQLARHLAAATLNVRHGMVHGSALVLAPGSASGGSSGITTLGAVLAEADAAIALYPYAPSGTPFRSLLEALKNALDAANNNTSYLGCGLANH